MKSFRIDEHTMGASVMARHIPDAIDAARREIKDAAREGRAEVIAVAFARNIPASHEYTRSTTVIIDKNTAKVENTAPHANVVEVGRGKNKAPAPVPAIYKWIIDKGLPIPPNQRLSAAIAISKKIGRDGIDPQWIFRDVQRKWEKSAWNAIKAVVGAGPTAGPKGGSK